MRITFWLSLFLIVYTYLGYAFILYAIVRIRRFFHRDRNLVHSQELPTCSLIIAAYNEENFIKEKIANTLALEYPTNRLEIIFITDGSDDQTTNIISECKQIRLMHQKERRGKVAAMHRAIEAVTSEIVIFTDANTVLNKKALVNIARHYHDEGIGAVAGEKRISIGTHADAGSAGEGFYWKYESVLKKWDSELNTVVGAAGELFSVRRKLYEPVAEDTILDDFMISMLIVSKKYRIVYEPDAYAIENASENVSEELKRKIRIAAGGIQSILRLLPLLNVFRYGIVSFQYISHRVLRWTITPFLLIAVLFINLLIVVNGGSDIYYLTLWAQLVFYALAFAGMIFENQQMRIKILFIPYYFCIMNYAVIMGIIRYLGKKQSAVWEKANRKTK